MLTLHDILLGVVIPFLATAFLTTAAPRLSHKRLTGGALAVSLGFSLGCILVFGWPGFRPLNDFDWLIPIAFLTAIIGTLAEFLHWRSPWAYGGLLPLLTWLLIHTQLSPFPLLAIMAAGWLWWITLDSLLHIQTRAPRRSEAAGSPGLTMTSLTGFTSLILMLSDSQHLGQLALPLLGSIAAIWLLAWWTKNPLLYRTAALPWATLLFGLLLDGKFWAGLTWLNAALLAAAPLLPWLAELPRLRPPTGWKLTTLRLSLTLLPLIIALTLAILAFQHAQQSPSPDYY